MNSDVMVTPFVIDDLNDCAEIMMLVYNNELWQCRWSLEAAKSYLADYVEHKRFIGYTLRVNSVIKGAIFCHEKIWWNNNEVFIDEMFIAPTHQRRGYGTELLIAVGSYIKQHNLAGITLSTNKYSPAPQFYRKNGFLDAEHVLFMYRQI